MNQQQNLRIFRIGGRLIICITIILRAFQSINNPEIPGRTMNRSLQRVQNYFSNSYAWSAKQHWPQLYQKQYSKYLIEGVVTFLTIFRIHSSQLGMLIVVVIRMVFMDNGWLLQSEPVYQKLYNIILIFGVHILSSKIVHINKAKIQ